MATTGRIFTKFRICVFFFENLSRKYRFLLKSENNDVYFTRIPLYFYVQFLPVIVLRRVRNLRKATIGYVMSVRRPSACPSAWNNLAPTGRIFTKFRICVFFFENLSRKYRFLLKSENNDVYFTRRPVYFYVQFLLQSEIMRTKVVEKIKTNVYMQ